jgi:coproporphyrinogen III oxidase-like Fe-S oxidoreductase
MTDSKTLEADYKIYYDNFMKVKNDREEKEKLFNEQMSAKLGYNCAGVSIVGDYDSYGNPKTFEEYIDWLSKADERVQHAKELEEKNKKQQEERQKERNEKSNAFNKYLNTLPKTYTVKEWRDVVKSLELKTKPIPRGTVRIDVSKNGLGVRVVTIKDKNLDPQY